MAGLSSPGIGSGLDVNTLVTKLMSVEQQPLTQLDKQEASYQTKITALGSLKGAISSLQSAIAALNDASKFRARTASSSNSSVLTGSASTIAATGTYSMVVSSLAQSQNLSSNTGYASATSTIGAGTLTFQFGTSGGVGGGFTLNPDKGTQTVTIDAAHNTLSGIADAINNANIGVGASIVNDGSTNGNRLVLTSTSSGAASEMKVTTTGALGAFAFDPTAVAASNGMTENAAATDAVLTINGLRVSKPSNTITDAIHGVTLNLSSVSAGTPPSTATTLTVARDDSGTRSAVQSFVSAYNDATKAIDDATAYDASTKQAGPLQGNLSVLTMENRMRNLLTQPLSSPGGGLSTLSDIGVTFQKDGTLALNASKLSAVLADPTKDVSTLFAAVGKASDALVSVTASTSATKPGSYAVDITQLATQGKQLASALPASLTITAGVNDTVGFNIDSIADSVTLSAGTYTPTRLAAEIQSRINGSSLLSAAGSSVVVGYNGTRGTSVGNKTLTEPITITLGSNDSFNVSVDQSAVVPIVLTPGTTYTAASLANEIQTQINAALPAGKSVVVSQTNGVLSVSSDSYGINGGVTSRVNLSAVGGNTGLADLFGAPTESDGSGDGRLLVTSNRYGSASSVSISGNASTNLLGVAPTATAGVDVAGTIGGASATGSGQYLSGSGNASGLKLLIDGSSTGDRGKVNFSQGFAYQLDTLTSSFLDSNGVFTSETDGINASIKDIGTRRSELQQRLVDIEARYRAQFNALDTLIASMQSTQSFLTQQLSSLSALANYTVSGGKG